MLRRWAEYVAGGIVVVVLAVVPGLAYGGVLRLLLGNIHEWSDMVVLTAGAAGFVFGWPLLLAFVRTYLEEDDAAAGLVGSVWFFLSFIPYLWMVTL